MKNLLSQTLLLLGILTSSSLYAGSTLRCGSGLISLGDSRYQVEQVCGSPVDRSPAGWREVVNSYGQIIDVRIEEWTYGPRNGMYHYLRFEGGVLVKISSSR